jgi:hypothetical protein
MSDIILGKLIPEAGPRHKDAIHMAVVSVVAGSTLAPGMRVGFITGGAVSDECKTPIGIVDPFLDHNVKEGESFWLCMFPKTVTNLRHEWTHPELTKVDDGEYDEDYDESWDCKGC